MLEPQYLENPTVRVISTQSLFAGYELPKPKVNDRDERSYYIRMFMEKINAGRVGTKYKPLSFVGVQQKLKHLSDFDVKWFYYECEKAKCGFSKCFFGALKERK